MVLLRGTAYEDPELDGCGSTTQAVIDVNNTKIPLCSSCVEELLESVETFKNTVFCYQCKNWIRSEYGNDGSCKRQLEEKGITLKSERDAGNVCWTSWMDTCKDAERKVKEVEIERKWLLKAFPDIIGSRYTIQETIYLSSDPEVRVRKLTKSNGKCKYLLTLKSNGDLSREEYESEVGKDIFKGAKRLVPISPIIKKHYKIDVEGHTIEFNDVDDNAFLYAEVEFKSEEEANNYQFPFNDLVIKEVTYDPKYKMKNYWKEKMSVSK